MFEDLGEDGRNEKLVAHCMKPLQQVCSWGYGKSWLGYMKCPGKNPKPNGTHRVVGMAMILVCLGYAITGCASGVQGTYTESGGNYKLELKSGGKASLTVARVTTPCTYNQSGPTITLTCEDYDDSIILTVHDDGSLTSPPGSLLPTLQKK
jgi:hypothetical protein